MKLFLCYRDRESVILKIELLPKTPLKPNVNFHLRV